MCRELEALQGDVVESKLTMDGKQKVGVATSKFIHYKLQIYVATTLGLPFNREVAMVFGLSLNSFAPKVGFQDKKKERKN